ncbi:MAG: discoidin domain-containing protein, partial [Verrucomicrobiales bacterium]
QQVFAADPRLSFPRPMGVGTPIQGRLPNLELPWAPRLSLKAPPEAVLLSRGKTVTSSDRDLIIGDVGMVTDGDKAGSDGSFMELAPGLQWVQIDLAKSHELHAVLLWHFHKNARAYLDVVVQVSDDPTFQTGVTPLFHNDHYNSSGLGVGRGKDKCWVETNHGRIIDIPGGKTARYIRLYSRGNTANEMNHYVEVEVFGLP